MEQDFVNSIGCVEDYIELYLRFRDLGEGLFVADPTRDYGDREPEFFGEVVTLDEAYELLLAIGNISSIYRGCWAGA